MKRLLRSILFALAVLLGSASPLYAQDTVNRQAPDFVTASVVIASPGKVLYTCVGHAFLRMQCPTYHLDQVYTYESEDIPDKLFTFFAGHLKMGMYCFVTEDYLLQYKEQGRGLRQYQLNLPPEVKQHLWELLDQKVAEGTNLPYDYLKRGCAQSCLQVLEETCDGQIHYGSWPKKYRQTRREIIASNLRDYPWTAFELYTLVGTEADRGCSNPQKVVVPTDLVEVLQHATINSLPIISDPPIVLSPVQKHHKAPGITPLWIAVLFVLLALISFFLTNHYIDYLLLILQTILGLFVTYLVCFSSLPCTDWNWLLIPFNPLPAICWLISRWKRGKWVQYSALTYAVLLASWEAMMILYPHRLTDPAYLVFVLSLIPIYLKPTFLGKKFGFFRKNS